MNGVRQLALGAVVAILVTAGFFFGILRPKLTQIAETRDRIEAAQAQESTLIADIERLREIRRDAPRTRRRLARVADLLPSTPELPSFIRQVQEAATREGIDLQSIAPAAPSDFDQGVRQVTVSLLIQASFHRTEAFLASLENLDRFVEVTSLAMSPIQDDLSAQLILATTISLRMFVVEGAA